MASRVWWLVTALIASGCHTVLGKCAIWPVCSSCDEFTKAEKINNNVTALYLSDCKLTTTNLDNLKYYPKLISLNLYGNNIGQIKAGTFDSLTNLYYLFLKQNAIVGKDLPAHLFQNWHSSKRLYISFEDNNMTDTPDDLFQGLDLFGLGLNNCSLQEYPSFVKRQVFQDMEYLQLEHNMISKLDDPDTFANNIDLQTLYFSNNIIDFLHADLLKPLAKIDAIYIKNNRIRTIPDGFFHNKGSLSTVTLANNLIEYLPANAFVGTRLGYLSVTGNRLRYLPANFLSELQTNGVSLKVFYFDQNPWKFSCVNKLLSEVKKQNIIYNTGVDHEYRHHLFEYDLIKCE